MSSKRTFSLWLGAVVLVAVAMLVASGTGFAQQDPKATTEKTPTTQPAGCEMCKMAMHQMKTMAKLKEALTEARSSAEAEGAKKTVEKIDEALKVVETRHQGMHDRMRHHMEKMHPGMMGKGDEMKCPMCSKMMGAEPTVVNAVCPISGKKFDPYNVPDERIREFQGKKVGFCCPACPPAWDKLTDQEKQEKLDAAMKSSQKPSKAASHEEHHGG